MKALTGLDGNAKKGTNFAPGTASTDLVTFGQQTGRELAYAELTTDFASTNTTPYALGSAIVSGLSITVTGTGGPLDLEFQSAIVQHSAGGTGLTYCAAYFIQDGVARGELSLVYVPTTTYGPSMAARRRIILANGVTSTFQVGVVSLAAGTHTWAGSASYPMYLSAVAR